MLPPEQLRAAIEAILFTARDPVTLDHLEKLLEVDCSPEEIRHHLQKLQEKYGGDSGILLLEVGGGWRLYTHEQAEPFVKRFIQQHNVRKLSPAGLEALAITAYRQPVTIAEINEIRGVETGGVIRTLLERRLIRMVGRKNVVGKPILYGTTPEFLQHFGIADLGDLPSLTEFEKLFGGEAKQALLFAEAAGAGTADDNLPLDDEDELARDDDAAETANGEQPDGASPAEASDAATTDAPNAESDSVTPAGEPS